MRKLHVMIVDDEPNCVETLKILLEEHNEGVEVISTAENVKDALIAIQSLTKKLDILFLDVQMPGGNGFSLLQQLTTIDFKIIFTTAYSQYAIKAIKFSAIDYLLKPIDNEELKLAISNYRLLDGPADIFMLEEVKRLLNQQNKPIEKIAVTTQSDVQFIPIDQIYYLKSDNNYTSIFTALTPELISSKNIGYYEDLLEQHLFFRIHNSILVNLNKVSKFHRGKPGYLELENGTTLEVSVRRKDELLKKLRLS
jgi:two-component system LytT family response regulator